MELLDKVVALENEAHEFGFRWENPDQIMGVTGIALPR